jgi:hypothetical protein
MDDARKLREAKEARNETENVHTYIPMEPGPFCWGQTDVMLKELDQQMSPGAHRIIKSRGILSWVITRKEAEQ